MEKLRQLKLDGFNVTVRYKEKIIPYLDEIDAYAEKIGPVNTVVCKDDKWIRYNTEGLGFVGAIESKYPIITKDKEKEILIIGAGVAAKDIYHALMEHGYANITIANRTLENADMLTNTYELSYTIKNY